MARVDLLISTKNDNPLALRKTLDSIQKSSFLDVRVLLVNDSDKPIPVEALLTGAIPIQIIENSGRKGLTNSLIAAANLSNADYLARADVGDELSAERISKQVSYMDDNPECIVVGCATQLFVCFDEKTESIGVSFSSMDSNQIKCLMRKTNPLVHGSILMRSAAYDSVGGYESDVSVAQDINLYLKMYELGDFAILNEILHRHVFYLKSSTTLVKNKMSVYSALKSRFKYLSLKDKLSVHFLMGAARDVFILLLPKDLLMKVRLRSMQRRCNEIA